MSSTINGIKISNLTAAGTLVGTEDFAIVQSGATVLVDLNTLDAFISATLPALTDGTIWIGDGTNAAIENTLSGDITMTNTGVVTIANNAITTVKINNDAVSLIKLAAGTIGALISYDASGDPVEVAPGTSGQILTSNGATLPPTFQTLADLQGVTSINADTTAAQVIAGTASRISLVDAGATHTFDIDATYVGQASITTLGTITTGVWTGTAILGANINAASTDLSDTAVIARSTDDLSFFAATTSLQLLGVMSDETGTGLLVFGTSPTLITPALGTPTALVGTNITGTAAGLTSGNVTTNANLTGGVTSVGNAATVITNANLTGDVTSVGNATTIAAGAVDISMLSATGTPDGTTFLRGDNTWAVPAGGGGDMVLADVQTVTGAKTFGTIGGAVGKFILAGSTSGSTIFNAAAIAGATTVTLQGITGTVALLEDKLSAFAATTSAELAGVISDETGSGLLVFGTSPTIVTPTIASFTNAAHDHADAAGGGTLLSTTALSDTADIAYLNQANTFGAFLNSFAASTMRIPLSATPTMAVDGDFAIDTTVTDFSHGIIKYFDGEELGVVSMPIAQFGTPGDGNVVTYNATNDEFELVPAGGGGLALTFDNELVSMTASQTDTTTPAVGESDSGQYILNTRIGTTDVINLSSDSGSNFDPLFSDNSSTGIFGGTESRGTISSIGNSTGRHQIVTSSTAGTRIFHQLITTMS